MIDVKDIMQLHGDSASSLDFRQSVAKEGLIRTGELQSRELLETTLEHIKQNIIPVASNPFRERT